MKKKTVATLLTISLISGVLALPKQGQAAAAGIVALTGGAAIPLLVAGGAAAAIGLGGGSLAYSSAKGNSSTPEYPSGPGLAAGFSAFVLFFGGLGIGLLLLDDENGQDVAFVPLSPENAMQLGISDNQRFAYNSELEEINVVRQSIQGQVIDVIRNGQQIKADDIHNLWISQAASISKDAFAALEKVSLQVAGALQK